MKKWISRSPEETRTIAGQFAATLKQGDFILLQGDLGAGKTEWVKGLARALGFEGEVSSPTFNLVHEYPAHTPIHHWDLYRLEGKTDWSVLDLQEHLSGRGITVVEWFERYPSWPTGGYKISIQIQQDEARKIICES